MNLAPSVFSLQCFPRDKSEDQWNDQNLQEVKDAEKIASDHFRIGVIMLQKQQTMLQRMTSAGVRCSCLSVSDFPDN